MVPEGICKTFAGHWKRKGLTIGGSFGLLAVDYDPLWIVQ